MNVLLVDDSEFFLRTFGWDIEAMEAFSEIYKASNEAEAYQLLEEKEIDVALLDIILVAKDERPDVENVGGIKILKKIKNTDKLRDIDCVMLSSLQMPNVDKQCKELGAFAYVSKDPNETYKILKIMKEAINKRKKNNGNS